MLKLRSVRRILTAILFGLAPALTAQESSPPHRAGAVDSPVLPRLRDSLRVLLSRAVRDSAFPGAIVVVGNHDGILLESTAGHLDWARSPVPNEHTLWDLASLTKVIALTTVIEQLVSQGKVDLDAPLQRYIPEWQGKYKDQVTIRHLLTHSSGLPAWRPLYKEATSPENALALAIATPLDTAPGVRMVYSDLGVILLGQVVVRVTGVPFDRYVSDHVFQPLGMHETLFRPPVSMRPNIAPTEVDPWRGRHLRGEVHDENAFALGGVSSHAGLFSSASDLARFARMYLNHGSLDGVQVVPPAMIDTFTAVQNATFSNRALGWEVPNCSNSAGHFMSSHAFGHTGFTGTSIWIDPDRDRFIVMLTNRVDPTRDRPGIGTARTAVADAVMGLTIAADSERSEQSRASCNH